MVPYFLQNNLVYFSNLPVCWCVCVCICVYEFNIPKCVFFFSQNLRQNQLLIPEITTIHTLFVSSHFPGLYSALFCLENLSSALRPSLHVTSAVKCPWFHSSLTSNTMFFPSWHFCDNPQRNTTESRVATM